MSLFFFLSIRVSVHQFVALFETGLPFFFFFLYLFFLPLFNPTKKKKKEITARSCFIPGLLVFLSTSLFLLQIVCSLR